MFYTCSARNGDVIKCRQRGKDEQNFNSYPQRYWNMKSHNKLTWESDFGSMLQAFGRLFLSAEMYCGSLLNPKTCHSYDLRGEDEE